MNALPVAVMVWPGAPPVAELAAAGAVRISLGSAIAQAAYAVAVRAATELLTSGTYNSVADGIAYDTMNEAITAAALWPGRALIPRLDRLRTARAGGPHRDTRRFGAHSPRRRAGRTDGQRWAAGLTGGSAQDRRC